MIKNVLSSLFLLILCIYFSSAIVPQPKLFVEAGTIGNKTFFVELLAMSNWTTAYRTCLDRGMFLATIEKQEERDLLREFLNEAGIPEWSSLPDSSKQESEFWVSGTDFGSPGAYYWMENGNNITESTVVGKIDCSTSQSYTCSCCCGAGPCTPTYGTCQCYASNCECSTACTGDCVTSVHDSETKASLRRSKCSKSVKLICHRYNNEK